jgi:very-short-patch-repair endonuclease
MHIDEEEVVKLYKENKSTYEIAEKYETYAGKIRKILLKNEVTLRSRSKARKVALKTGAAKHPTKGKKRSEATKKKISMGRHKAWLEMPEEEYDKFCKGAAERWELIPFEEKIEMQRLAGSALRKSSIEGSKAEKSLYMGLLEAGYKVEQHKKDLIGGEYELDFYLPDITTVIEIDGPQHFLPVFGEESLKKTIKYDSVKNGVILTRGFAIIRVKYLAKKLYKRIEDQLFEKVTEEINKIQESFPKEGHRLIEIEVK